MKHLLYNNREELLWREFGSRPFRLLDVGAGNNSATVLKSVFPNCEYWGVDRTRSYNMAEVAFSLMHRFVEMDVTKLVFTEIPDAYFDAMVLSHIIEHLPNGDEVLRRLVSKVRMGGVVYVEYPGLRSLRLPSMRGTLNFTDDPTHVRMYTLEEVRRILTGAGCRVLSSGTRRNWLRMVALPAILTRNLLSRGYFEGSDFWELLGFAEYVYARRGGEAQ